MPSSRPRKPRKPPQQERSRATLDAIVTAATRIFSTKGYQAATMSGIARTAGVSIGSLYQYASTKSQLAELVMKRRSAEIVAHMQGRLLALGGAALRDAVPAAVRVLIEGHRMHARLPALPFYEISPGSSLSRLREFERRSRVAVRVYLEAHRRELRPLDLELAVVLLVHMTDAAVHAALEHEPAWLEGDVLASELTRLWLGYLAAPAKAHTRSRARAERRRTRPART